MKDMFYKYNNYNSAPNMCQIIECDCNTRDVISSASGATVLKNISGKDLGVVAKEGTKFVLYFNFYNQCKENLHAFLAEGEFYLDILDHEREIIQTIQPKLSDYANELQIELYSDSKGPLKYGVYYLHLYLKINEEFYTLFSEKDGILTIN